MSEVTISKTDTRFDWLLSPLTVLISMAIGVMIGIYQKDVAVLIAPFGDIYLSLLQMCILPVLICAVASSLGELVKSHESKRSIGSMVLVFSIGLILTSGAGILAGIIGQPGTGLGEDTQAVLGQLVHKSSIGLDIEMFFFEENPLSQASPSLLNFFVGIVPSNIMESMTNGNNLQVLFFAIVLGVAAGFIPGRHSDSLLLMLSSIYLAFSKVIKWAMYILPFGLCCLMADQVSRVGPEILIAMTKFVIVFVTCGISIVVICTIIIWKYSGKGFVEVIVGLKEPIIIALGTRNSLATIPSSLDALHTKLKFDKTKTNLLVPLGVTICRYGSVVYFSLATMFVAQLYDSPLDFHAYVIILIGSILAGMATSGASGVLTLAMMLLVLEPLGLPFEAVLVLFIAIDPIVDPLRTLLIVYVACASSAIISGREVYKNPDRVYFEDESCFFESDAGIFTVISIDSHHIHCLSSTPLESESTSLQGALKYSDSSLGQFHCRVIHQKIRADDLTEYTFEVIGDHISVDTFIATTTTNKYAEVV